MLGCVDGVCPLLRLAGERHVAIDGVDAEHRCHALDPPETLDRATQSRLCLTDAHQRCDRLLAYQARHHGAAARLAAADGFVSTRLLLTPQPAWRGIAGRARRPRSMMLLAGLTAAAAVTAVIAGLLADGYAGNSAASPAPATFNGASRTPPPTSTAASSPSPRVRPTATATAAATPTASATATATPTPTPVVTAAPTPTPAPRRTYTVVAGDTLALIAQRFGTTVAALQAANDISDPNIINVGQVLVIP